jgi:hypothetical protein
MSREYEMLLTTIKNRLDQRQLEFNGPLRDLFNEPALLDLFFSLYYCKNGDLLKNSSQSTKTYEWIFPSTEEAEDVAEQEKS